MSYLNSSAQLLRPSKFGLTSALTTHPTALQLDPSTPKGLVMSAHLPILLFSNPRAPSHLCTSTHTVSSRPHFSLKTQRDGRLPRSLSHLWSFYTYSLYPNSTTWQFRCCYREEMTLFHIRFPQSSSHNMVRLHTVLRMELGQGKQPSFVFDFVFRMSTMC